MGFHKYTNMTIIKPIQTRDNIKSQHVQFNRIKDKYCRNKSKNQAHNGCNMSNTLLIISSLKRIETYFLPVSPLYLKYRAMSYFLITSNTTIQPLMPARYLPSCFFLHLEQVGLLISDSLPISS